MNYLPSSDTALFKCFGIDWAELCDMWMEVCDETCESDARMLVTVEGCKGGRGQGDPTVGGQSVLQGLLYNT